MLENAIKEGYVLREKLQRTELFDYDDSYKIGLDVFFKNVREEDMIKVALQHGTGNAADCQILYLLSKLQYADITSVRKVFEVYGNMYKSLDMVGEEQLKHRIKKLRSFGFVAHTEYKFPYRMVERMGKGEEEGIIQLFSVTDAGMRIMNHSLKKREIFERASIMKPLFEKIGLASNAHTIACCMKQGAFKSFIENHFVSKEMVGRQSVPCVIRFGAMKGEEDYRICFIPAYLIWDKAIETEEDYKKNCRYFAQRIKNWFGILGKEKGMPLCIITVKDNTDLNMTAKLFYHYRAIRPYLNNIYFTGESILKEVRDGKTGDMDICSNFLKMRITADESDFDIYKDTPPFLETSL